MLPLESSPGMSTPDAVFLKNPSFSNYRINISNEEMRVIKKIVKPLEESGLLVKGISETIKNETKH